MDLVTCSSKNNLESCLIFAHQILRVAEDGFFSSVLSLRQCQMRDGSRFCGVWEVNTSHRVESVLNCNKTIGVPAERWIIILIVFLRHNEVPVVLLKEHEIVVLVHAE